MLSALLEVTEATEPADLAATLSCLVVGAVEGVLRDVAIVDAGMSADGRAIVEQAGCDVFAASQLAEAIRSRRGEWVLVLEPGAKPVSGWVEMLAAGLSAGGAQGARSAYRWRLSDRDDAFWRRLMGRSARGLRAGLVMRRAEAGIAIGRYGSLAAMARATRTQRLDAVLVPARRR